ncbi:MAG: sigma-70 family RNA polymerase sigma factor [Actinomycetota bacterium]
MEIDGEDRPAAEGLEHAFEANRSRLHAVAYRMLGSHADAEEAVQETWLRLSGASDTRVDNLGGWLTTVIARICLDRLRGRRASREVPLAVDRDAEPATDPEEDPEEQYLVAESVGAALVIVLDALGPAERVAFVLHDVFAVPFDEIAGILRRSPEAVRQLASRARRRVQRSPETASVDLPRHRAAVEAFLRAARSGDFEGLLELLDPEVALTVDTAAERMGALRGRRGAAEVAGMLSGGAQAAQVAIVDGFAALIWAPGGHIRGVIEFTVDDGRIGAIRVTGNRARIASLDIVPLPQHD